MKAYYTSISVRRSFAASGGSCAPDMTHSNHLWSSSLRTNTYSWTVIPKWSFLSCNIYTSQWQAICHSSHIICINTANFGKLGLYRISIGHWLRETAALTPLYQVLTDYLWCEGTCWQTPKSVQWSGRVHYSWRFSTGIWLSLDILGIALILDSLLKYYVVIGVLKTTWGLLWSPHLAFSIVIPTLLCSFTSWAQAECHGRLVLYNYTYCSTVVAIPLLSAIVSTSLH